MSPRPRITPIISGRTLETRTAQQTPTLPPNTPTTYGGQTPVLSLDQVGQGSSTSRKSVEAHHSTIFERFELSVEPVYNYYVESELTEPSPTTGSLDEIPRYVRLKWRAAPEPQRSLELPTKGRKTPDRKTPVVFDRSGFSFSADQASDFDLASRSLANGFVSPGTVRARVETPVVGRTPTRAFNEELHLVSESSIGIRSSDARSNFAVDQSLVPIESTQRVPAPSNGGSSVTFVDPGIAGFFSDDRISAASDPHQLTSIMSLAQLAANLEMISEFNQVDGKRVPAPEFPAPADFLGVSYIGYIIEKHRVHADGSLSLAETITIDDPTTVEYVDRNVLFGTTYSYRMRSVVRWTRSRGLGFSGTVKTDIIAQNLSTTGPATYICSFYAGDWSPWSKTIVADTKLPDPPDEIHVRTLSHKSEVHITWKIPDNSQRDLMNFVLYRKVRRGKQDASEWKEIAVLPATNGLYIDRSIGYVEDDPDVDHVYAMRSETVHGEVSLLSTQLACVLTRNYQTIGEEPIRFVSHPGVPLDAHGQLATIPVRLVQEPLSPSRVMRLSLREGVSAMPLFTKTYVIRVTSELTGETADLRVSVDSAEVGFRRARSISAAKSTSGRNRRS